MRSSDCVNSSKKRPLPRSFGAGIRSHPGVPAAGSTGEHAPPHAAAPTATDSAHVARGGASRQLGGSTEMAPVDSRALRPLEGVVLFLHSSIPHLKLRLPALQRRLESLGGKVAGSGPLSSMKSGQQSISHVVMAGGGSQANDVAAKLPQQRSAWVVTDAWLNQVASKGMHVPEGPFSLTAERESKCMSMPEGPFSSNPRRESNQTHLPKGPFSSNAERESKVDTALPSTSPSTASLQVQQPSIINLLAPIAPSPVSPPSYPSQGAQHNVLDMFQNKVLVDNVAEAQPRHRSPTAAQQLKPVPASPTASPDQGWDLAPYSCDSSHSEQEPHFQQPGHAMLVEGKAVDAIMETSTTARARAVIGATAGAARGGGSSSSTRAADLVSFKDSAAATIAATAATGTAGAATGVVVGSPQEDFALLRASMAKSLLPEPHQASRTCRPSRRAPLARYYPWLGYWHPWLDQVKRLPEFMMWARFSSQRSISIGNEPVAAALRQLHKYEEAIGGTKGDPGQSHVNHRALNYAHAAAAVRACCFQLTAEHTPDVLQELLPFVAGFTSQVIYDLVTTGSCEQLEAFQADLPVKDSRGRLRTETYGGHTRWMFGKIPGVGAGMAAKLYEAGYSSYEDLQEAAGDGGPLSKHCRLALSQEARFCIQHHRDILADVEPADVEEMQRVVLSALDEVSGQSGFQLMLVGGGRRSHTVHDADFLATHPTHSMQDLVWGLYKVLVAKGKLVSQTEGFCRIQSGKQADYMNCVRRDILENRWTDRHQMDRFDHIWGVFRTTCGRFRRMDVMLVPRHQWQFGVIGWTGSKQYLRFMRTHASQCHMFLNSHCLMRKCNGMVLQVPSEVPPLDAKGQEFWPQGWGPGKNREVVNEEDLFQLLRIPFWHPEDRDCP